MPNAALPTTPRPPARATPLHALHARLGAKIVDFAGWRLPVTYPAGVVAEHRHCRSAAALFDVSHMGQLRIDGADAAAALESLVPADVVGLEPGQQRYTFFTDVNGGIVDDLMLLRPDSDDRATFGELFAVVNASRKDVDVEHVVTHAGHRCRVTELDDRALLALQGPQAAVALHRLNAAATSLRFMRGGVFDLLGVPCGVTRSGYTGEDGFEISVPAEQATALAEALLAQPEVRPAGLAARDTLRLEAGLCLYGQDIDTTTSPVEAALAWAIAKVRRAGGEREGGYPGADVVERQLAGAAPSKRVGLVGLERVPVRAGATLVDAHGHKLGRVTSGTITPTVDQPVAMGYLPLDHALAQHEVYAEVRSARWPMRVAALPFVPHRYLR